MSVTITCLAVREVPVSGLTLVTLSSVGFWMTITLPGHQVALIVLRSNAVAVAGLATVRRESISSWRAFVTLPADDIRLALAVTSMFLALLAKRTSRVAIAG